jgi:hypothetical protein
VHRSGDVAEVTGASPGLRELRLHHLVIPIR